MPFEIRTSDAPSGYSAVIQPKLSDKATSVSLGCSARYDDQSKKVAIVVIDNHVEIIGGNELFNQLKQCDSVAGARDVAIKAIAATISENPSLLTNMINEIAGRYLEIGNQEARRELRNWLAGF